MVQLTCYHAPRAYPWGFAFFFLLWWSIAYPRASRRKEFPTPELLIDVKLRKS